nr:MAG TPA: hypothetical protein [Caudoviricetes sp.]
MVYYYRTIWLPFPVVCPAVVISPSYIDSRNILPVALAFLSKK